MKKLLLLACTSLCAFSFYAQTSEVQNFTLVDADTNTDILTIEEGMVYDADAISTGVRLNIRANANGVGSVDMRLRGALAKNRTETSAPYALYGDNNGNYFGTNFPLGAYTLTATPYSGPGATGTAGEPLVVNFTFAVQPMAVASANVLSGEAPLEVQFTGSNSQNENPDNTLEYLWDFGDGATATEADPLHVFQNPGNYTVQLTTTNIYGFSDTASLEITVSEPVNVERPFITTWKTDNQGVSADNQISIPTFSGETYNYTVDWGDGTASNNVSGNITHTYVTPGVYTVSIIGNFPRIFFANTGDKNKILTVEQWGDIKWSSMVSAFAFCGNLDVVATDIPDFSETTSLSSMFFGCSALVGNATLNDWNVNTINVMANIFNQASLFNQDISGWDVGNVNNFDSMFSRAAAFNQPIGSWNVSRAEDMSSMFFLATSFNQDIGNWSVDNVIDMTGMFNGAVAFNQDIGNWNVGNVIEMNSMFAGIGNNTSFNQDISQWNVSSVESMFNMFANNTAFNQDIGGWNVEKVRDFRLQFSGATSFDQNLADWDVQGAQFMADMFSGIALSQENYDATLIGWNALPSLQSNVIFGGGNSQYCMGEDARQNLIATYGWTITDGGIDCPVSERPFITTWKTDNPGPSGERNDQISILTHPSESYNYTVDWGDGSSDTGVTGAMTHTYASPGTYTVSITGDFPRIYSQRGSGSSKLLTVEQWGDIKWSSMQGAFTRATSLDIVAADVPDLSNVTSFRDAFNGCSNLIGNSSMNNWDISNVVDLANMFKGASSFNENIESWDLSSARTIESMFYGASQFNQPVGNWNIGNVDFSSGTFKDATSFNQDISQWKTGKIRSFRMMFSGATSFNQNIGDWDTSNVQDMVAMFQRATSFNQDIGNWDVSKVFRMDAMFEDALSFDQNLGSWNIASVVAMTQMFKGITLSSDNYDSLLFGWNNLPSIQNNVDFEGGNSQYCREEDQRQNLISERGWVISDGGISCPEGPYIDSFTFVGVDIGFPESSFDAFQIRNGKAYDIAIVTGFAGNIRANTNPEQVGSVVFSLSGPLTHTQTENVVPYALFGDISGVYNSTNFFTPGEYSLTATPYSGPNGTGEMGEERVVNFALAFKPVAIASSDVSQGEAPLNVSFMGSNSTDENGIAEYFWNFGDGTTSKEADPSHSYTNLGDFTASLTVTSTVGLSDTAVIPINVIPQIGFENAFITTWKTDNSAGLNTDQITIPTFPGEVYNYTVDWGDGQIDTSVTGDITHTYDMPGSYTVSIVGDFPRIYFLGSSEANKIITVEQWGAIEWTSMEGAFANCFSLDIIAADVPDLSLVTSLRDMFRFTNSLQGNSAIGLWDVSSVTDMTRCFRSSIFNQDISNWNVTNVIDMTSMFEGAVNFNQDIGSWDVSNLVFMDNMFSGARSFNQNIGNWNVSRVTGMSRLFLNATDFNQDISQWEVSNMTSMDFMFDSAASFDQDLNNWNVSNVTSMIGTFQNTQYNRDISAWDVGKVTNMNGMFGSNESFDQDLGNWNVGNVRSMIFMFSGSSLSTMNYDKTLMGWSNLAELQRGVNFSVGNTEYCLAENARQRLIDEYQWNIFDGGLNCSNEAFITTWKTDNPGISADNQITIPTSPEGEVYNYTVDWGDGSSDTNVAGNITHTYSTPGVYDVAITGQFPRINFRLSQDREKIIDIKQWGDIEWSSFKDAFNQCTNLDMTATDIPDLSNVTSLASMFLACVNFVGNPSMSSWDVSTIMDMNNMFVRVNSFNQDIGGWNVSNVVNMVNMFQSAQSFNQDIGDWDVSNVTNMSQMFDRARDFNQDIGRWNVSKVTLMGSMFANARDFNQDIGGWNVNSVIAMSSMFLGARAFNQNLGNWDISNVSSFSDIFSGTALSVTNYDQILMGWASLPVLQPNIFLGANEVQYCTGENARQSIMDTYDWVFSDGGWNCEDEFFTDFVIVNPIENTDILQLNDGDILDIISDLNGLDSLNIRANVIPEFEGSILFSFNTATIPAGPLFARTENRAPYALFGDDNGNYFGQKILPNSYTLRIDAFAENNQIGVILFSKTINFTLTNQAAQKAPYQLSLSPNAAITEVNVSVSDSSVEVVDLLVYDMQGRMVASFKAPQVQNANGYQLPVSAMAAGTYILTTIDKQGVVTQKQLLVRK